ncbi:hypothetical protein [Aquimarina sp. Aq78]|uniref:hypothetical protein n=1 Tax=Aquimarina TaxID=290174 RepID=UPI00131C99BB|nr:hypothetical protein [Aquimarina sp. Aq78]
MKSILNVNGVKKLSKELQKSISGSGPNCYQMGDLCCRNGFCGIGECNGRFCMWG